MFITSSAITKKMIIASFISADVVYCRLSSDWSTGTASGHLNWPESKVLFVFQVSPFSYMCFTWLSICYPYPIHLISVPPTLISAKGFELYISHERRCPKNNNNSCHGWLRVRFRKVCVIAGALHYCQVTDETYKKKLVCNVEMLVTVNKCNLQYVNSASYESTFFLNPT